MKKIENREEIPSFYGEGFSTVQISKMVGLSVGAVASILKSRGVKLRSSKEGLRTRFPNGRYGKESPRWSGGKRTAGHNGYVVVYSPNHPRAHSGAVFEHILVAEKTLGRPLEKGEVVHHINHDRKDNRPENLQVVKRGQHVHNHFREPLDLLKEIDRLKALLEENHISY